MKLTKDVTELISPIVLELGYELYEVAYKKEDGTNVLDIIIDKNQENDYIDLDDCEKVSRAIDPILEEADIIADEYCLCVSSPGADRKLKKDSDYQRNMGKDIEIKLYKSYKGSSKHIGTLKDYNEETVTIVENDEEIIINKDIIAVIKQYVSF